MLVQQPLRWSRLVVAGAGFVFGITGWAQNAVSTYSGTANTPGFSNTAPGLYRFTNPSGVVADSAGNLFIADAFNNVIRRVAASNGAITTFAGSSIGASGNVDNSDPTVARFSSPQGIAIDGANNLYVADSGNHAIRMITSAGVVTTIAGTGGTGSAGVSGFVDNAGTLARFSSPTGIAADRPNGVATAAVNLYVADSQNNAIRKIVIAGGTVTTLAGSTTGQSGFTNNSNNVGTDARFSGPAGVATNAAGTILFVADRFNSSIRQIIVSGTNVNVSTLAGTGATGYVEGTGVAAAFNQPTGIALNAGATTIYVSDTLNHAIRSITTGGVTSLFAGTPQSPGYLDAITTSAKFSVPSGIAVDTFNVNAVYVVDTNNSVIRKIAPTTAPVFTTQPQNVSAAANGTAIFGPVVTNSNPPATYQWQVSTDSGGTWTNLVNGTGGVSGATSNQLSISSLSTSLNNTQYRVVANNGVNVPTNSNTVLLTVTQAPAITSANSFIFVVNQQNTFSIVATGAPAPDITVSTTPGFIPVPLPQTKTAGQTTATLSGTPTDTNGQPFTFTITASNGVGSPATQLFTLNVSSTTPPQLSSPGNQQLAAGGTTASFSVTATGSPTNFTYQWQRSTDNGLSWVPLSDTIIDGATYSGSLTANLSISGIGPLMNSNQYRVVVTSGGGTTNSFPGTLLVPPQVTNPSTFTFTNNQGNVFSFTASGNPAPSITVTGTPPTGVTLSGTTLSGTPSDTFNASYPFTVTATNSGGSTVQNFTLVVATPQAPFFTSVPNANLQIGQPTSITFTAGGAPTPTIQLFGTLPPGLIYNPPVLSGTPTAADGSPYTLTAIATNQSGSASQTFVITVQGTAPVFTLQPVAVTANVGDNVSFTTAVTGNPTPTLHWQRQPNGTFGFFNLTDDGVFGGTSSTILTITGVTAGMSLDQFRVVANNGTGGDIASNPVMLTVNVGTVITTIAGQPGFVGASDGTGITAKFNGPAGIAVDFSGNMYIADSANHTIRKITSSGLVTTLAGSPGLSGSADGIGNAARFNSPQGVAVDGSGNVYVADTFNHTIRVVSPFGNVTTLAGQAGIPGSVDGPALSGARFFSPTGVAVDIVGSVYVADSSNHSIRKVSAGNVITYAGALGFSGYVDTSPATSARFNLPSGVALDNSGNLYVADSLNHVIRRIGLGSPSGGAVTTIAGGPGIAGSSDGTGTLARFNRPMGVAVGGPSGDILVADTQSDTIRRVTQAGVVTTVAGLAFSAGSADGAGATARFNLPQGIAVDISGNIYVADTRNNTIRRTGSTQPPLIQTPPINRTASVGSSAQFTVTASGSPPPGYQWQRQPAGTFGFLNLTNDLTFSGVTTATMTIANVSQAMNGDQFRVIANNGVQPAAVSSAATLNVGAAPVFTSAATASFQAGQAGKFTVVTTSDTTVTYTATNLPSWAALNPATGEITGTPPDTGGAPFTVTITAANGITATQTLTINVTPAVFPPTITSQPSSTSANQGGTATLNVTASGTAPFTYQWRREGVPISGATSSSLAISNIQPSAAGNYSVVVTNSVGSVTSSNAAITVNTPAAITAQPQAQIALAGGTVTFSVGASGGGVSYQWRRNGIPLPGANSPTLTLTNVSNADVGNYDVVVSNGLGFVNSSLVQLTIATGSLAPTVTTNPASHTVLVGRSTTFNAGATGVPSVFYQWRKDGANIIGANGSTYSIASVQSGDAGTYDVVVTNTVGSATSRGAVLRVISRSYAGYYFGTISGTNGNFALFVRDDNTGTFLGFLPGQNAPVMGFNVLVNDNGTFSFSQNSVLGAPGESTAAGEPSRAAALGSVAVTGVIGTDGSLSGSLAGGANASLSATRASDTGASQSVAGFYQSGSSNTAAVIYTIAGPAGQSMVLAQSGNSYDGGLGTVTAGGSVAVSTGRSTISETISGSTGVINGSSNGAINGTFSGGSDLLLAQQRLVNISSRARVGTGDSVAIAGFVIAGEEAKPVLIRAVGPTIGAAPFNVAGALASPRLELFRGTTSLAVNTGIAANRTAIDAAGAAAGAFLLGPSGADAAILTTLPPGAYTAVVSSTTSTAGVALVEVYDLSATEAGQKMLNIATRAPAGTSDNTLIAGFVIPAGPSKRVLVRAVGPGLAAFGVSGVIAQPNLILLNGSVTIAQNANWTTSADAAAITLASAQAGAFALANNDSAMIATLAPGNYTAQVLGANNTSGVALIEVYELP